MLVFCRFKFSGTPSQLKEGERETRQICDSFEGDQFKYRSTFEDPLAVEELWGARKNLLFNCIAWSNGRQNWITDVCVPIGA